MRLVEVKDKPGERRKQLIPVDRKIPQKVQAKRKKAKNNSMKRLKNSVAETLSSIKKGK